LSYTGQGSAVRCAFLCVAHDIEAQQDQALHDLFHVGHECIRLPHALCMTSWRTCRRGKLRGMPLFSWHSVPRKFDAYAQGPRHCLCRHDGPQMTSTDGRKQLSAIVTYVSPTRMFSHARACQVRKIEKPLDSARALDRLCSIFQDAIRQHAATVYLHPQIRPSALCGSISKALSGQFCASAIAHGGLHCLCVGRVLCTIAGTGCAPWERRPPRRCGFLRQ
jgi:hypothetical protein